MQDLLGARLTDGCQPPFVCWESNWGPLEETASANPLTRLSSSALAPFAEDSGSDPGVRVQCICWREQKGRSCQRRARLECAIAVCMAGSYSQVFGQGMMSEGLFSSPRRIS